MNTFVKDWKKKPIFILSIGVRKSGKSYNTLALLKFAMENNIFQNYILCLPCYEFEQTDSYKFVKEYQKKLNIKVFDRYSYLITRAITTKNKKINGRTLIFIDDAMLSSQSIFEPNFYGMLSIARHLGISLIINYHSLTSGRTLSPFVRQNIDYLCLYKIVSEDLLKMVYDEYLSLATDIKDWKDFRNRYIQHVNAGDFKSVLLNARTGETDWDLKELKNNIPKCINVNEKATKGTNRKQNQAIASGSGADSGQTGKASTSTTSGQRGGGLSCNRPSISF